MDLCENLWRNKDSFYGKQSACVVYFPLSLIVTFSKPHNVFNTVEEFVGVCIIGILLRILNFYGANFKIQPVCC